MDNSFALFAALPREKSKSTLYGTGAPVVSVHHGVVWFLYACDLEMHD